MRKLLLLYVILFYAFGSWAADFKREIVWNQSISSDPKSLMSLFKGAVLTENVPFWVESFPLQTTDANVSIKDTIFEPYEGPLSLLPDSIKNEIRISAIPGTSVGNTYLRVLVFPFIKKGDKIFKLVKFTLSVNENPNRLKSLTARYDWKQTSLLSTGKWTRIKIINKGIYKITYDQLRSWGYPNPENVVLYGNGGYMLPLQNKDLKADDLLAYPVWKGKDNAGQDCLFFYATGNIRLNYDITAATFSHQQNYYATETYFYLSDQGTPLLIQKAAEITANAERQVSTYPNYTFYEKELQNLIESGSEWYGESFNIGGSRNINIVLTNPDLTKPAKIKISAVGMSETSNSMDVMMNGKLLFTIPFSPSTGYNHAMKGIKTGTQPLTSANVPFRFTYKALAGSVSEGWLDYVGINYQSLLSMNGDLLNFWGKGVEGVIQTSEFVISGATAATRLLNVTNLYQTSEVPSTFESGVLKFKSNSGLLNEYVAFNPVGVIPTPELAGVIANQNLHGEPLSELIIVTNPTFLSEANDLAEFHRTTDQMSVQVVTPDLIYNEFSGGLPDPAALRNYFRMCYERGKQSGANTLKYVLLMGDGSYDNRNILGKNLNLLPTYQSEESLSETLSFVTDDFFAFLDENEGGHNGIIDLGIGRIPAHTLDDAKIVVEKIKNYHLKEAFGNWRNVLTFIGDDGNADGDNFSNIHQIQANNLTEYIRQNHPGFFTDKIFFDAYRKVNSAGGGKYPDVTNDIFDRLKRGTLILNYTGHANTRELADEDVMDVNLINRLTNNTRLPIFVTASCEYSRFDANESSGGEFFLFNPAGGGIGLFSTTRLVYSERNYTLNLKFFEYVFEKDANGKNLRLGDVMRLAKANANTGDNQLNFSLLADPALRVAQPEYKVITTSVNGKDTQAGADTLSTMSVVSVKGFVADGQGVKMSSFNGEIVPTVYDKAMEVHTLGNEHQQPLNFMVQNNIIYTGLASVKDGEFEFSFFVPKDVSYKLDRGKIIYYAYNETDDANGFFDDFYIGGASNTAITDEQGPAIDLFMNSDSFREGGKVSASSVLIANISDETGINTSGTGIGHDITAVLDGDYANSMVLNDYFQASLNKYTEGTVVFPLNNLSEGEHTLTIKVWDVLNNSSEKQITFVVKDEFRIESVACFPNPMENQTSFIFTHNQPDEAFKVTLEVFQTTGARVDKVETTVNSNGIESLPLEWDPAARSVKMKPGVYIYRLTASVQGRTSSGSGRLVYVYPK